MSTLSGRVRGGGAGAGDGAGDVNEGVRGEAPGGGGGEGKNADGDMAAGNVDHRRALDPLGAPFGLVPLLVVLVLDGRGRMQRSRKAMTGRSAFIVCGVFDGALGNGRWITAF